MNRHVWVLGAVLAGLVGCEHTQTRSQAPDDDKEAEVQTIGDITTVSNAQPITVTSVGLVEGLDGTGGEPIPGPLLSKLEEQLRKEGVEHIKDLLASPQTSVVIVNAIIPPGARPGDPLDIDVSLPPRSKTTSLRGGYLRRCKLRPYEELKNLSRNYAGNGSLPGNPFAEAAGPLVVAGGNDPARLRHANIWGGGKVYIPRPYFLVFNEKEQRAPVVQRAVERINETFHGPYRSIDSDLATASSKTFCYLKVPAQYRLNQPRYLRVVRLIPMQAPPARGGYRAKLEEQLLDPAKTVTAALRLEALGTDSIPALKRGLTSKHTLVQFTSAESLAYLGDPACGETLARLVEEQPALRAFCLTAMASLDEAVCHVKLRDLLSAPGAETRYGAFRALRSLDEREPAVRGELLNHSFWVHKVAPQSPSLVHMATSRRAEVVIFGDDPYLLPPFSFLAGEFAITSAPGDRRCTLSRLSAQRGTQRRQCSLRLDDVLHTLADLGGMYPEVIELLRQAGNYRCLTCPVAVDALPQAVSVYELAQDGAGKGDLLKTDREVLDAQDELGATPALYQKTGSTGGGRDNDQARMTNDERNPKSE